MCCILRITKMEMKTEHTWNISVFWKLLIDVLSQVMEKEDYKFNLKAIMVDKKGAN